jgi:hypothetical protein
MNIASGLGIGIASLLIGAAMVWFARPNTQGQNPPFLRFGLLQMLYPAIALLFVVLGVTELLFLVLS